MLKDKKREMYGLFLEKRIKPGITYKNQMFVKTKTL